MSIVRLLLPDGSPVDLETHGEDDYLTRRLRSGWYELDLLQAIQARNRPGIYVDAGAHIGSLSVWLGRCCPATSLVCIEPFPASADILARNLARALDGRLPWAVLRSPLGELAERVILGEPFNGNTGNVAGRPARKDDDGIECMALDGLGLEGVALLKADVQGMEYEVLTGAAATIQRDHPLIAVEAMTEAEWARTSRHPALEGYCILGRYCASPTYLLEHP